MSEIVPFDAYQPPYDEKAEYGLLIAILLGHERPEVIDAAAMVSTTDFYRPLHQSIFSAMKAMLQRSEPMEITLLCDELKDDEEFRGAGGASYLMRDLDAINNLTAAPYFAQTIRRKALQRGMAQTFLTLYTEVQKCETSEVEAFQQQAVQALLAFSGQETRRTLFSVGEVVPGLQEKAEAQQGGSSFSGIPLGIPALDRLISGLEPSDTLILAADTGMGKSAFAVSVALNCAKSGGTALIASLEMNKEQVTQRLSNMLAGRDTTRPVTEQDWRITLAAHSRLLEMKNSIHIDESPGLTPSKLRATCQRVKAVHGLDIVILDYLQLMRPDTEKRNATETDTLTDISRELKRMAAEMECAFVILSQLNRQVHQQTGTRPEPHHLRGSHQIAADANYIIFLYDPDKKKDVDGDGRVTHPDKQSLRAYVAKNRTGRRGEVDLVLEGASSRFTEMFDPEGKF